MTDKLNVQGTEITILRIKEEDYICLTDMLKAKDGDFFITDWLRNRNTLEYIGIWEKFNNPDFNYGEFAIIRNSAGLNNFKISVKEFVERTGAICIQAKAGRYGGTYAQRKSTTIFIRTLSRSILSRRRLTPTIARSFMPTKRMCSMWLCSA